MRTLLQYAPTAAFYLLALAAQISGYTSRTGAAVLFVVGTALLLVPAWPYVVEWALAASTRSPWQLFGLFVGGGAIIGTVIGALALGGYLIAGGGDSPTVVLIAPSNESPKSEPSQVSPSPAEPPYVTSHVVTPGTYPGKDFVSASVTPGYLIGLFQEHTAIQASKLTAAYLGKWMKLSDFIYEVSSPAGSDYVLVTLNGTVPEQTLTVIILTFNATPWADRLSALRRGDAITIIGKIEAIKSHRLELNDCELVDDLAP